MSQTAPPTPDSLVAAIPKPDEVRGAIRHVVHQTAILRHLLRLSERRVTHERLSSPPTDADREAAPHE